MQVGFANQKVGRPVPEFLLAACAILVLAAIIIKPIMNTREKGRETACRTNIHQIAQAMMMYNTDFDDRFPVGPGWHKAISQSYMDKGDMALFICQSRPTGKQGSYSYGMNKTLSAWDAHNISYPSEIVMLCDVRDSTEEVWWANDIRFMTYPHNRNPLANHNEKVMFTFCDGHVQRLDRYKLQISNW